MSWDGSEGCSEGGMPGRRRDVLSLSYPCVHSHAAASPRASLRRACLAHKRRHRICSACISHAERMTATVSSNCANGSTLAALRRPHSAQPATSACDKHEACPVDEIMAASLPIHDRTHVFRERMRSWCPPQLG